MNERNFGAGLILIGIGVLFAMFQLTSVGGEAVVAVIGGSFLVAYAVKRLYGFLVAGGIMTGLGLGILWEAAQAQGSGAAVLIGLGVGFLSIYVIDLIVRGSGAMWWPVIPGGIIGTIGALVALEQEGALEQLDVIWPIALVVVGALLLILEVGRRPRSTPKEP